jgi:Mrp family chromosome partitioning ATPase
MSSTLLTNWIQAPAQPSRSLECADNSRVLVGEMPLDVKEHYGVIRRRLVNLFPNGAAVLVTSAGPSEGKTLTTLNLGLNFSSAKMDCVVAELDLRRPGFGTAFGNPVHRGIEDVLTGKVVFNDVLATVHGSDLNVLSVKRTPKSAHELLETQHLPAMIAGLRKRFKWVLVDTPPVFPFPDVETIAPYLDGALFVVRMGKTERSLIARAIEGIGTKVLGVVVNDQHWYSGYSYRYRQHYG